jgi:hypothetical protein
MDTSGNQKHIHRKNGDRSYDSICLQCFRTVAVSNDESVLVELENLHKSAGGQSTWTRDLKTHRGAGGQFAL